MAAILSRPQHINPSSGDLVTHDVIKRKHFPRHWPFARGIWSPVNCPHKGQWRWALLFFLSVPEQTVEQTIETLVIWDAIALMMTSLCCIRYPQLLITIPVDALAPHGTTPSAGIATITNVDILQKKNSSPTTISNHFLVTITSFNMAAEISRNLAALRVLKEPFQTHTTLFNVTNFGVGHYRQVSNTRRTV